MHSIRHHLSPEELEFIAESLRCNAADFDGLIALLSDPEEADKLLGRQELYSALSLPNLLPALSLRFYFYVRLRSRLTAVGIDDRDLTEYIACRLAESARQDRWLFPFNREGNTSALLYSIDLQAAISGASPSQEFFLLTTAGNHYLLMTSVFSDYLEHLRKRRATPSRSYYEDLGARSFEQARDHRLAREYGLTSIFDRLHEDFPLIREGIEVEAKRWRKAG